MGRKFKRIGEIAGHWLSRRPRSSNWYASWYENRGGNRQTRFASLGTEDLREAEIRLAEFVTKNARMKDEEPSETPLTFVLVRYWEKHAKNLRSSVQAKIALALWTEYWGDACVFDLTPERQEEFVEWLKAKGFKNSYVSRTLSVGRAALRRALKRQEIKSAPVIIDERDRSDQDQAPLLKSVEVARLLHAARKWPHLFLFCMIGLNTLARPDAILDLAPIQVSRRDRRINLNPPGRKQTKKFRPIVPITDTLMPFLAHCQGERFVMWAGKPIVRMKRAFEVAVQDAGLSKDVTAYSLRHTMATELRRRGVPSWEVEGFLGHRASKGVTESYAKFSPDYLSEAVRAIDAYFAELGEKFPDLCPGSRSQLRDTCVIPDDVTEWSPRPEMTEKPGVPVVGATGIEPVTPTMST